MKSVPPILLAITLAACGSAPEPESAAASPPAARAVLAGGIDLASCEAGPSASCPGFVIEATTGWMKDACEGAGGRLSPMPGPRFWQLDVNGDGRAEYLADLTENFQCENAYSVFSCGSLGCPYGLYTEQDGTWQSIGQVLAGDAPEIELLAGEGYVTLRGGCSGVTPCDRITYYSWDGEKYGPVSMDVRGHQVRYASGGFWTLTRDVTVRAEPHDQAEAIGDYAAGTEVVVMGEAADPAWKYVSPCNACGNGFVPVTALARAAPAA